ncbi:MAG: hypothetical protein ACREUG_17010 [Steroidobacteraceae bacterium]
MDRIDVPRLNKATMDALERVFAAEIEGRLPLYSKAKIYDRLCEDGLVEFGTFNLGKDRFGVIRVQGWSLTHAGRLAYCMNCPDLPDSAEPTHE